MTEIKNNKEEIPLQYYMDQFAQMNPSQRAKELTLPFADDTFQITMLGSEYRIHWPDAEVHSEDPKALALHSAPAKIFLLRYLLTGKPLPFSGSYKSFRELPWGEVYIKPFTGRCLIRMAWKFNSDPEKFAAAAETLGGVRLDHADAGFRFDFIEDYHLLFYLWKGDDEFPPNAQVEYSDNFAAGFMAEDSVVAAELIISAISAEMKHLH